MCGIHLPPKYGGVGCFSEAVDIDPQFPTMTKFMVTDIYICHRHQIHLVNFVPRTCRCQVTFANNVTFMHIHTHPHTYTGLQDSYLWRNSLLQPDLMQLCHASSTLYPLMIVPGSQYPQNILYIFDSIKCCKWSISTADHRVRQSQSSRLVH